MNSFDDDNKNNCNIINSKVEVNLNLHFHDNTTNMQTNYNQLINDKLNNSQNSYNFFSDNNLDDFLNPILKVDN